MAISPLTGRTTILEPSVRIVDLDAAELAGSNAIEAMYDDELDVVLLRNVFPREPLAEVGRRLAAGEGGLDWLRPNPAELEGEDIWVLGIPLTPSGTAPRGPAIGDYLDSADAYRAPVESLFGAGFAPRAAFEGALGRIAGGRPVELPRRADGRAYAPYTVRLLAEGQGIGVHHDYHFGLPAYAELTAGLDKATSLSFFAPLAVPQAGGELFVYALTLANPDKPELPNGRWDPDAIAGRYHHLELIPQVGDLIVFASGRCLHRVAPTVGATPRITMGGFLAFDGARGRVLYWS